MSTLDQFNEQAQRSGGRWAKLKEPGDTLKGKLLGAEIVDRTDPEGLVVLSRKTQKPRKVYRLTVQTELAEDAEDDGVRIFDANESAQTVLRPLLPFKVGGTLAIQYAEAPADSFSQATYKAAYRAPEGEDLLVEEAAPAATVDELL